MDLCAQDKDGLHMEVGMLQCDAVCCSVLQCVAVCCSVCCRVCCSMLRLCAHDTGTIVVATMGLLRFIGSLKLLVSFAKEPYKRDDILHMTPIILMSLLIVPYAT